MALVASRIPRHKTVPGTKARVCTLSHAASLLTQTCLAAQFVVDAFRYPGTDASAYFLTHGHSDHYGGLSERWSAGPVYCTEVTARLVAHMLRVPLHFLRVLPYNTPVVVEGVSVVAIDANHCPGAVQLLFTLPDGRVLLHSGDMRFSERWLSDPHLLAARERGIEQLFLDTTYCHPRYCFPAQDVSVRYVAEVVREGIQDSGSLFLISTYGIGKERILSAVAAAANCAIQVSSEKHAALSCLGLADMHIYTTATSPVRVVSWGVLGEVWPYYKPNWAAMEDARVAAGAERVVGFVPTGWTHEMQKKGLADGEFPVRSDGACTVHLVPYSEHSSFDELRSYVRWLRPREVVPTVNVDKADTKEGERLRSQMLKHFATLIDETSAKRAFFKLDSKSSPAAAAPPKEEVDPEEAAAASGGSSALAALRAVLGDAITCEAHATQLLRAAHGDVNAAVNAWLDGSSVKRPRVDAGSGAPAAGQHSIRSFFKPPGAGTAEATAATPPVSPPPAASAPSPAASPVGSLVAAPGASDLSQVSLPVAEYDPAACACWAAGEPAPYLHVAATCEAVVGTRSRLLIGVALTNCFRSLIALSPDDVLPALYLITGRVAPDYEGNSELNVGGSAVSAVVAEATGASRARLSELYRLLGDIGDAAAALKSTQRLLRQPPQLSVRSVFSALRRVAAESGNGGVARRKAQCMALLRAARGPETRFLVRFLVGNMRIGASRVTVLAALAAAAAHARAASMGDPPPSKVALDAAAAAVAKAYSLCPNFDVVVPSLLEGGTEGLAHRCRLTPGVPCSPMLAQPTTGVADALARLGADTPFLTEWKYDGQRAQCHIVATEDGRASVRIFTRNGAECTSAFPDAAEALLVAAGASATTGAVFDGELVAVDVADGHRIRPFQELATRARGAVAAADVSVHVCIFLFDCLCVGGASMVDAPLSQRRAALQAALPGLANEAMRGRVQLAASEQFDQSASEDLQARVHAALKRSLDDRCEGLMLKDLAAPYEPDKRSAAWLKLKKDYMEEHGASELDLVPIGAWHGQGRKAKWFSPFLLAAYDRDTETWTSVCRVMSGFSDALYKELFAFFTALDEGGNSRILPSKPPYYVTGDTPDVWLAPTLVWEVRGADLSLSPRHTAATGLVPQKRGVSLRFPRFIRTREDLRPDGATTPPQLAALYHSQKNKGDPDAPDGEEEEEL